MICSNCGADFSVEEARCPYCGTLNPSGAEKAYMETLADLKDDTSELAEESEDVFKANLHGNVRRTVTIAIAFIALIAAFFLVNKCMADNEEQKALQGYQAREAFRAKYFDEFDRLYEAGDDDALSEYAWSLMDDPGFDALFSWKHIGVLQAHDDWEALKSAEEDIEGGTASIDDYAWTVSVAMRLAQLDADDSSYYAKLSPEEEARVAPYRAYAWQFLQNTLQMNEEEIRAFADEVKDAQGHIQEDALRQPLKARLTQIGTLR